MKLSLPQEDLIAYIERLILSNFPDGVKINSFQLYDMIEKGISRTEDSFKNIEAKYYLENDVVYFNHLNSDHMTVLLYFAANSGYKLGYEINLVEKLYNLNKTMHCVDIFYTINLPKVFCVVHPLGSILGNAKYGNYMCIYQGVTIGSNTLIGAGSVVVRDCEKNSIYAGNPAIKIKDVNQ